MAQFIPAISKEAMGDVWKFFVPNHSPSGSAAAGYAQRRPAVIAYRCKIGKLRAALSLCLSKTEIDLYIKWFPVV